MAEGTLREADAYELFKTASSKEAAGEKTEEIIQLYKKILEEAPGSAVARAANRAIIRLTGVSELSSNISLNKLLFSFEGRISRSTFWANWFLPITPILLFMIYLDHAVGTHFFIVLFLLIIIYPSITVCAKRCHDRNRSGWFQAIGLIPLLNIWVIIELGFLKGTSGDNKYGSDQLLEQYER